jgi:hypothetical protein
MSDCRQGSIFLISHRWLFIFTWDSTSTFIGVADFGYDFYLLAIAKLLHGQYFRLLDFYFHTLIQQRPFIYPTGLLVI